MTDKPIESVVGKKFGWLEVIDVEYTPNNRKAYYLCSCECSTNFRVRPENFVKFTDGKTNSDICLRCFQNYKPLPDDTFKWIPNTRYAISSDGKVWSGKRSKILVPITESSGYSVIKLGANSKVIKIHRLVAEAFIPNVGNKPCVNHINGVKSDNRVENLEWVTYSENTRHALDIGLSKQYGEDNPKCKLSYADVEFIKNSGKDTATLMGIFHVSRSTINRIMKGVIRKNG
jgi:hypothetical protein